MHTFTIKNVGSGPFSVQAISNAPATDFLLTPPATPAMVAPNATLTFTVTAAARAPAGHKTSTVTIATDIAALPTITFEVSADVACATGCDSPPADAGIDAPDTKPPGDSGGGGGCCETGGGSSLPTGLVGFALVAARLRRKRPRR
jgi:hypothetical protein